MAARAMSRRPQIPSVIHNLIPAAAATPTVPEPEIRGYVHPDFEPVVELFAKVCMLVDSSIQNSV